MRPDPALTARVKQLGELTRQIAAQLGISPELLAQAQAAAADEATFDGFVFEALRFNPAFPYFFRTCHTPTVLAGDRQQVTGAHEVAHPRRADAHPLGDLVRAQELHGRQP